MKMLNPKDLGFTDMAVVLDFLDCWLLNIEDIEVSEKAFLKQFTRTSGGRCLSRKGITTSIGYDKRRPL